MPSHRATFAAGSHSPRTPSRLSIVRYSRGLSQGELAEMAGVARETISRVETGRTVPRLSTAQRIAAARAISLDEIFGRDGRIS